MVTHVMNPKSMHRERLLGHMDIDTREWTDGVLTDAARKVVREPSETSCWIICDGDVDPEVRTLHHIAVQYIARNYEILQYFVQHSTFILQLIEIVVVGRSSMLHSIISFDF